MTPAFTAVAVARGGPAAISAWIDHLADHAAEIVLIDPGDDSDTLTRTAAGHATVRIVAPDQTAAPDLSGLIDAVATHSIVAWLPITDRIDEGFWDAGSAYLRLLEARRFEAILLRQTGHHTASTESHWTFRLRGLGSVAPHELRVLHADDRVHRGVAPVPPVKLGVSILVHEAQDVIEDQIANFRRYLNDPAIVFHVNRRFVESGQVDIARLASLPGVFVNPEHLDTQWGGTELTLAIVSNFRHLCAVTDFDFFVLHASNDLYVRRGAERRVSLVDAGFALDPLGPSTNQMADAARDDEGLSQLCDWLGATHGYVTGHEGTFFRRGLFAEIAPLIDRFARVDVREQRGLGAPGGDYGKEEFYFSTAAAALALEVGDPLVYRDWVNQPSLPIESVQAVRDARWDDLPWRVGSDFYAVKRVARHIDDPVRQFIRDLPVQDTNP